MKEQIKDLMYSYANKGISTIPCNKKHPAINGWNSLKPLTEDFDIFQRIDDMFDNLIAPVTGLAVLHTEENPHLGCFDIDSYDTQQVDKVMSSYESWYSKIGRKGKSFYFRHDGKMMKLVAAFPMAGGLGNVEVFTGNKYTVIPPSLHSTVEGEDFHYYWENADCTLLHLDSTDDLPFISTEQIMALSTLLGSASKMVANNNLPRDIQYKDGIAVHGRLNNIKSAIGTYVSQKNRCISMHKLIEFMLDHDSALMPNNSFFDGKISPRKEIRAEDDRYTNCERFCLEIVASLSRENKITREEEASIPIDQDNIPFRSIVNLKDIKSTIEPFKEEWIPPFFRQYCKELADAHGTGLQSVLYPLIGAFGGILQSKIVIRPIKNNDWYQRPNFATVLLAYSGSKKTDTIKTIMKRCYELDKSLGMINSRDILDEQQMLQDRVESLYRDKKKLGSAGDFTAVANIISEIRVLQDQLDDVSKKVKSNIWMYGGGTVQKMILDHSKSTGLGLFLTSDELGYYIGLMNKKGNEDLRNYLMEILNGTGFFKTSTISRGTDLIDPCYGSILCTTQPSTVSQKFADLHNPSRSENDGFWQRFDFITMGEPNMSREEDFDTNKFLEQYKLFDHAFKMEQREVNVFETDVQYYKDCLKTIEARAMKYYGKPVGSFLSKYQGKFCKYAVMAEFWLQKGRCIGISREGMDYAMKWLEYLGNDLINQFHLNESLDENKDLEKIVDLIKGGVLKDGATMSEWHQKARGSFRNQDYFFKYLRLLENYGYISLIELSRNSKVCKINPLIRL